MGLSDTTEETETILLFVFYFLFFFLCCGFFQFERIELFFASLSNQNQNHNQNQDQEQQDFHQNQLSDSFRERFQSFFQFNLKP